MDGATDPVSWDCVSLVESLSQNISSISFQKGRIDSYISWQLLYKMLLADSRVLIQC